MDNNELDAIVIELDACRGASMLKVIAAFLSRFIAYPSDHAKVAHALWCVHTHLMDKWESTPRLAFLSPEPASGKTRALEITELLVPNAIVAVNVSPAYLFRRIGGSENGCTVLFDEIDTIFGPKAKENEEIRGLLNAGHRRGATAGRCIMHGSDVITLEIQAYAAVALAGLGWLPDTLLSRSIIIRMRRRHAGERVEPYRRRLHVQEGERIRRLIEVWAPSFEINGWPQLPSEVVDRDADMWEPLIAIADACGGEWPERARKAAVALVVESIEREPSLGIKLLADLRTVFGAADVMASKSILELLHKLPESPWADLRGKPLDERGLANRLRQYGIKSKNVRIGGQVPKGYDRADLHDAWQRYLPLSSPATGATSATSATSQVDQAETVADVAATVADVAPATTDQQQVDADGIDAVADVAAVADLAEDGRGPSWRDATGATSQVDQVDVVADVVPTVPDPQQADETGAVADLSASWDGWGLTPAEIYRIAVEVEEAAGRYVRENGHDLDFDAEIRRRLQGLGVFPEFWEIEADRVWQRMFGF